MITGVEVCRVSKFNIHVFQNFEIRHRKKGIIFNKMASRLHWIPAIILNRRILLNLKPSSTHTS